MATGACGINCNVCKLNLNGTCSTCGPGTSAVAAGKLSAQQRILGAPCAILACAQMNQIEYCLRDCSTFPCTNFSEGPYPYSGAYLDMQTRRRSDTTNAYAADGSHLEVDAVHWEDVADRDRTDLCNWSFFEPVDGECLQFRFLNEEIRIDLSQRSLLRHKADQWQLWQDPLLTLATVMYLKGLKAVYPMGRDIVGCRDLKEGHFLPVPTNCAQNPFWSDSPTISKGSKRPERLWMASPWIWPMPLFNCFHFPGCRFTSCCGEGMKNSNRACRSFLTAPSNRPSPPTLSGP
jgi:hypothetical protein